MASQTCSFIELHEGGEYIEATARDENWKSNFFLVKIMHYVCALLNTVGIMRSILFDCHDMATKDIDNFKQRIENKIKGDLGPNILIDYVHINDIFDGNRATKFTCVVGHCSYFCSLQYNLYFPAATQIIKLNSLSKENIMAIINNPWKSPPSQLIKEVKYYKLKKDEPFTKNESDVIQFKYFDQNGPDWEELCKKIDNSNIQHYISAFANYQGGRIYYGIEDKENKIIGQQLEASDQNNITDGIQRILQRMVCGKDVETKPKLGTDFVIQYLPVCQNDGTAIENLFVIAVSVRFVPNGVFTQPPKSYEWKGGKPVLIEYQEWRRRVQVPNESFHRYSSVIDRNAREKCFEIINEVVRMIDSGNGMVRTRLYLRSKLEEFGVDDESQGIADPKVITCYLQLAYCYFNVNMLGKAYEYMAKAYKCFKSVKNRPVLELHYSCLLASLARKRGLGLGLSESERMGFLDKSLRLTYECLAETDAVLPGWENAIVWKTHGNNLVAMASCEKDPYRKMKRRSDAEYAWCKAIEHAQKALITRDSQHGKRENQHALMNIIQNSHLYIALLHLWLSPTGEYLGQQSDVNDTLTADSIDVRKVKERLAAVIVTMEHGYPFLARTEFLHSKVDYIFKLREELPIHICRKLLSRRFTLSRHRRQTKSFASVLVKNANS